MLLKKVQIISGGFFKDNRGVMRFVNDAAIDDIKRFYFIKHPNISVIRAWQGHQFEKKMFFPITGSFVVAWIKIDNFSNPNKNLVPEYHILKAEKPEIIIIPKGYANGLKALEPDSEIMILSDLDVNNSIKEKVRYSADLWFDWEKLKPKSK